MIALKDLSVAFDDFHLEGITLEAGDGEYIVLLGPSGAGKTVLLEVIAGLRIPDSGTVIVSGREMDGILPEYRGTALVYQDYALFPHMTAAENVAYGLKLQKTPAPEIHQRVDELLGELGIPDLKDRYPGTLSGGEQQRVALARALATSPAVLLLDEPFASLDPRTREECIGVMQRLKATRSITILQVSHSGDEAYALADRVVLLLSGRIAQTGTPDAIFRHPASPEVAQFVGMENILAGTVMNDGAGRSWISTGSAAFPLPVPCTQGAAISIGIPAGCIHIAGEPVSRSEGKICIFCRVREVRRGRETATLRLEGVIPLTAVLHRGPDDGQIPAEGSPVYAVFRESDIRILSGAGP